MKETNRRKSLPPFHQGITELCRSISVDLTESKRLSSLLLSSFQFSVQKLEPFLRGTEGFSLESFRAKASSLSEELKHFADKLESNGTLQKCFEDSEGRVSDLALETSVAEMKEYITKFSLERQSWDQLCCATRKRLKRSYQEDQLKPKILKLKWNLECMLGLPRVKSLIQNLTTRRYCRTRLNSLIVWNW